MRLHEATSTTFTKDGRRRGGPRTRPRPPGDLERNAHAARHHSQDGAFRARPAAFGAEATQGTAAYSRFVNRPAGRVLASIAFARGLSPNQVSYISGGLSLAGIVLVALGRATVLTGLAVTVLLALGYAMDSADGQVARLTHGGRAPASGSIT